MLVLIALLSRYKFALFHLLKSKLEAEFPKIEI